MPAQASTSFLPLLLVLFLAFLVPVLLARFKTLRIPVVVGEIIAGIIIGRSGFDWVSQHDPVLDLLAEFGFVFLMFLSGMEIDFSSLRFGESDHQEHSRWHIVWGPVQLGGLTFALSLLMSIAVGLLLTALGLVGNPWMMALILSTTSLGVVLPVLKENGLTTGRFGQTLLMAALIADFATMLLITVLVTTLSEGLTVEVLLVGILFVAFVFLYRSGIFFFNRIPGLRRMLEELNSATTQIKMRAAFTIMLVFVALSEVLGAEVILGAFLAGAILSLLRQAEDTPTVEQLGAVGFGFFIPIFFIMVGVDFNLPALLDSPSAILLLPMLLVAAYGVKFIPALTFRLSFSRAETLSAGALLGARLSLIIAASAIGLRLGLISEEVNAAVILVAIVSVTTGPLLFVRLFPRRVVFTAPPIVVVGAERLGLQLAEHLQAHHEAVVIIDESERRVDRAQRQGFTAITGRIAPDDPNTGGYLNQARVLVCAYSDLGQKYRVCRTARVEFGIERVITMLAHRDEAERFANLGVRAITLDLDWAIVLAMVVRSPAAYELLTREGDEQDVREVPLRNPALEGMHLRQLPLPGNVRLLTIRRRGELLMPIGTTRLEKNDYLSLAGSDEFLEEACRMFGFGQRTQ